MALGLSPFIMASTESIVGFVLNSSLHEYGDIYISGQNMFVALGQAKISIFIALLRKVILLIPFVLIFSDIFGVMGVFAAESVADAAAAITCIAIFSYMFPKILSRMKNTHQYL